MPALEALAAVSDVVLCVCQPDRPAGRGLAVAEPPVKVRARELGIEVIQPTKVRTAEFAADLRARDLEVAVVMAYGRILPPAVLEAPRRGCLNLHASILPRYRGAAPITWSVVNGETVTGVSLMQMDEGMDTGPVFTSREVAIGPDATAGEVSDLLAACAAEVVRLDLPRAVAGELRAAPQDAAAATMAPMLKKDDGRIDWSLPARRVHDHARGMTPWPGAWTTLGNKLFKILVTRLAPGPAGGSPGEVVVAHKGRVEVACGEGRVEIVRAQVEGKKALGATDLVAGRTLAIGTRLGHDPA